MTTFVARTQDYRPENDPEIVFSGSSLWEDLCRKVSVGDKLAYVCSFSGTAPRYLRGKIAGCAEVTCSNGSALAWLVCDDAMQTDKVPLGKLWRFSQPVSLDTLEESHLPYYSSIQITALNHSADSTLLEMPKSEVASTKSSATQFATPKPKTGPAPPTFESTISRDANRPAYTYVARFGQSEIWKIGHTVDPDRRLRQLNLHIPIEEICSCWRLELLQNWESEADAHEMEQALLYNLAQHRTHGERVRCPRKTISAAWATSKR